MTSLILNDKLEPENKTYLLWRQDEALQSLPNLFLTPGANRWQQDGMHITEEVFEHTIPDHAAIYHVNYLEYLQTAYQRHLGIVMSPEVFWYSVMAEVAQEVVLRPEPYREIFTTSQDKIDIMVPCGDINEPLRMDDILQQMRKHLPIDPDLVLPEFSTANEMSRMATLAAFLEASSPYYNYMMFACGIPKVKILGTSLDWSKIVGGLIDIQTMFGPRGEGKVFNLMNRILPIARSIMAQLTFGVIDADRAFWSEVYRDKRCGSGSQYFVDGWWARTMFMTSPQQPEACNFSRHITKVPYTILPTNQKWKLCFGLTHSYEDAEGFFHPRFSRVQVKIHDKEIIIPDHKRISVYNVHTNPPLRPIKRLEEVEPVS